MTFTVKFSKDLAQHIECIVNIDGKERIFVLDKAWLKAPLGDLGIDEDMMLALIIRFFAAMSNLTTAAQIRSAVESTEFKI